MFKSVDAQEPKQTLLDLIEETEKPKGRKDDAGKIDMTLLEDMPLALYAVAEVMQWACTQKQNPYERGSWQYVQPDRYRAAMLRHIFDAAREAKECNGKPAYMRDKESNLLHAAHVACSAMMHLELVLRELNESVQGYHIDLSA